MRGPVNGTGGALRRGIAALLGACCVSLAGPPVAAADTCYQDPTGRISQRRRPGYVEVPCPAPGEAPAAMPGTAPPQAEGEAPREVRRMPRRPPDSVSPIPRPQVTDYVDSVPVPDRWRIVEALGYRERRLDPYNRNVLKADRPVHGDWFFNLGLIADSVVEYRDLPTPVGGISTARPGQTDIFGGTDQWVFAQNLAAEFVYYKGDTVFKPPDYEFRFTPVFNVNHVRLDEVAGVNVDPRRGRNRTDEHIGIQAAFFDKHLRNVSERYDFDSLRIGIQPFSSDFRGFLFQDNQLGVRLFGTRQNNRFQYNLAWFRRLEKDTNSGLNDLGQPLRDDDIVVANLYWQDMPVLGFTSQATVLWNRNRENDETHYNENGFIERPASLGRETPRRYDVVYLGYNGDGHFGRVNLTTSLYFAFGKEKPGLFVPREVDIRAFFGAAELSLDFDWIRPRLSLLYASGDKDPFDDRATGFDAPFENPQFAGADTSYWIRQAVPLIGGGRVALAPRNGVLPSLRSSKEEGQSNFTNPGLMLVGIGADFDVLPTLRLSVNLNALAFANTATLEVARNQGRIRRHIGEDLSVSLTWRPLMSQNIVVRGSYAKLFGGSGFDRLFPGDDPGYWLLNAILTY